MKLFAILLLCLTGLSTVHAYTQPQPLTFSQAKGQLKKIYHAQPETFYCGCGIKWITNKKLVPVVDECGYTPRNELTKKGNVNERAKRIEWEHVVPAWEFGHQLQCWQKGKRKYCAKNSPVFKRMEGDLHNLVPAIGEINSDRSNFKFSMISGEERVYGRCDAEVDFKRRIFEPSTNIQGDIARTYFYFERKYSLKISKKQRQLFSAWDKMDPVDFAECDIHSKKARIQGNVNPFIQQSCH